jgi:hypothetical protein
MNIKYLFPIFCVQRLMQSLHLKAVIRKRKKYRSYRGKQGRIPSRKTDS